MTGLFQELVFGSISWDYSKHWLNIGGRVSLKMAFLWGVLGILFVHFIYPYLSRLLNKCRGRISKIACIILTVFIAANLLVSSMRNGLCVGTPKSDEFENSEVLLFEVLLFTDEGYIKRNDTTNMSREILKAYTAKYSELSKSGYVPALVNIDNYVIFGV